MAAFLARLHCFTLVALAYLLLACQGLPSGGPPHRDLPAEPVTACDPWRGFDHLNPTGASSPLNGAERTPFGWTLDSRYVTINKPKLDKYVYIFRGDKDAILAGFEVEPNIRGRKVCTVDKILIQAAVRHVDLYYTTH